MTTWFEIKFTDDSVGYIYLEDNSPVGVYRADGTPITPEEHVEYTCINDNASAPSWYVPPQV